MPKRVGVTYRNTGKVIPYENALREVGIEPVLIRPGDSAPIEALDGLLLTGGTDVNLRLFHQEPHEANDLPDDKRDHGTAATRIGAGAGPAGAGHLPRYAVVQRGPGRHARAAR